MLIVLEGMDHTGKSSLAAQIKTDLESLHGLSVGLYKEPVTVGSFKNFYDHLHDPNMDSFTLFLLFLAQRNYSIKNVLTQMLNDYDLVIADRYSYSTQAYQIYTAPNASKLLTVFKLVNELIGIPEPDYIFYLQVTEKDITKILHRAVNKERDILENMPLTWHTIITHSFDLIFNKLNNVVPLDPFMPVKNNSNLITEFLLDIGFTPGR